MKTMQKMTPTPAGQPVFRKVAENLYRLESSNGHYALLKRGGKQFRRSLKAKDCKLADSRLNALHAKIGGLQIYDNAKLNFDKVGKSWLEMEGHDYRTPGNLSPTFYWKSNDAAQQFFREQFKSVWLQSKSASEVDAQGYEKWRKISGSSVKKKLE